MNYISFMCLFVVEVYSAWIVEVEILAWCYRFKYG